MSNTNLKDAFLELLATADPVTTRSKKQDSAPDRGDHSSNQREIERGIDVLLPLVDDKPLYVSSDDGASHIYYNNRLCRLDVKNKELSEEFRLDVYEKTGKAPSRETVATVIELLSARARRTGEEIELFNRIGAKGDNIYYDMADGAGSKFRLVYGQR